MKKSVKTLAVFFAVVLLAAMAFITASAAEPTNHQTIELETRSILLVDRSGSIEDKAAVETIMSKLEVASFDAVGYFDTVLTAESGYTGGGNSSICEAIDEAADAGFTHISVITDGEQWPVQYSALGIYTDLDLTIHLVEESEDSEKLINELKSRLVNSSLKVVTPEGEEESILNDYKAPIYTIEIPKSDENVNEGDLNHIINEGDVNNIVNEGDEYICDCDCCKCNHISFSWWWLLLLLLPLLGFLIWWLLRNWKIARKIKKSFAVVDCSKSMAKALRKLYRACRSYGISKDAEFVRFGEGASIEKLSFLKSVQGEGATCGTEGLQLAIDQGKEEVVLFSDLEFNGKEISSLNGRFSKVSVVVPSNYSSATLDEIRKIADEVEVLHL